MKPLNTCNDIEGLKKYLSNVKGLSKYTENNGVTFSVLINMDLSDYVKVSEDICSTNHKKPCMKCKCKMQLCDVILRNYFVDLKSAFRILSPDSNMKNYRIPKAKRLVLQLPLVNIKLSFGGNEANCVFSNSANVTLCKALLATKFEGSGVQISKMSKEKFRNFIKMARSDDERERLTCLLSEASGLRSKQMKKMYGVSNLNSRKHRMDEAIRETEEIRTGVELLANLQVNILKGFGVGLLESEASDIDSTDDETDLTFCEKVLVPTYSCETNANDECSDVSVDNVCESNEMNISHQYDLFKEVCSEAPYMNPHQLIDLLRELELNWFAFARA